MSQRRSRSTAGTPAWLGKHGGLILVLAVHRGAVAHTLIRMLWLGLHGRTIHTGTAAAGAEARARTRPPTCMGRYGARAPDLALARGGAGARRARRSGSGSARELLLSPESIGDGIAQRLGTTPIVAWCKGGCTAGRSRSLSRTSLPLRLFPAPRPRLNVSVLRG
ncbi:hypothetical protein DFH07DRAFT_766610 [Mycena maculata]|uniref:Uncharacterized protein n=1 Tax=Mycena maculata TaxID=230809 RepID=A0AAD7K2M2_9AGAR|nr:hypothetical protein DFH07DRAFT_766610 [Mycena maculata]